MEQEITPKNSDPKEATKRMSPHQALDILVQIASLTPLNMKDNQALRMAAETLQQFMNSSTD